MIFIKERIIMKKTFLISLVALAALNASSDFAHKLDKMNPTDLNEMNKDELKAFRTGLDAEKKSKAYTDGLGAYKGVIDNWDKDAKLRLDTGSNVENTSKAIPERMRPVAGKTVIDMFKVTAEALLANPDAMKRFARELQDTVKSPSYQMQPGTKAKADEWIAWLNENGVGKTDTGSSARGQMPPPSAAAMNYVHVQSGNEEQRRVEQERIKQQRRLEQERINQEQHRRQELALQKKKKEREEAKRVAEINQYYSRQQYQPAYR